MENVAQEIISRLGLAAFQDCKRAVIEYMDMEKMIFEQVSKVQKQPTCLDQSM